VAALAELPDLTLERARRGDERAWRDLVAMYQQPIHGLIWRIVATRAPHRVPDLVQETFVRVLRALPKFDRAGAASFTTWTFTIATRLALNELRRIPVAPIDDEPVGRERTDAASERARLGAAIERAMRRLTDEQRAILVLREYHELDYDAIADATGVPLGTIKSRLARARSAFRELIAPELDR